MRTATLTNDGERAYFWDDENRLIAVETLVGERGRSEYTYDAQWRRIRKVELSGWTNGAYTVTNTTRFIYDGWSLLAEYSDSVTNYYICDLTFRRHCRVREG